MCTSLLILMKDSEVMLISCLNALTFLSTRLGHGFVWKIAGKESQRNGESPESVV